MLCSYVAYISDVIVSAANTVCKSDSTEVNKKGGGGLQSCMLLRLASAIQGRYDTRRSNLFSDMWQRWFATMIEWVIPLSVAELFTSQNRSDYSYTCIYTCSSGPQRAFYSTFAHGDRRRARKRSLKADSPCSLGGVANAVCRPLCGWADNGMHVGNSPNKESCHYSIQFLQKSTDWLWWSPTWVGMTGIVMLHYLPDSCTPRSVIWF